MTRPLALIFYEKLLPGSSLVNRLQDMQYRVQAVTHPSALLACAQQEKPLLVFVDLNPGKHDLFATIASLKRDPTTQHIPIVAFRPADAATLEKQALTAGATLVVAETAVLNQLAQIVEQALQVS